MDNVMQLEEILQLIKSSYEKLSDGQKQVAEYLLKNLDELVTSTALQIGLKVGVSDATVIRFAMAIGFKGFADLQDAVRKAHTKGRTIKKFRESVELGKYGDGFLSTVLEVQKSILDRTFQSINKSDFDRVVDMILAARSIVTVGLRSSASLSLYLGNGLQLMLGNTRSLSLEAGFYYEKMLTLDSSDLVIAMSFPRYTKLTYELVEYARKKGAKIVCISDSVVSPVARLSEVTLIVPADIPGFQIPLVGAVALAEAIMTAVSNKAAERVEQNLSIFEELVATNVFL